MELDLVASFAVPAVLGVVWLVRLEGRVNLISAKNESAEKRVDGLETRIFEKLDRIENKLDGKADR